MLPSPLFEEKEVKQLDTSVLEYFNQVTVDPSQEAIQWKKETDGKVFGFLLTDIPEELIHAAGFFPFGIYGGNKNISLSDAHLQFWICTYCRSSFALALSGELDFLDGLLISHKCDTTRMMMGIWQHNKPLSFMDSFRPPRQVERASARTFFRGELKRLKAKLEDYSGKEITAEELTASIKLYNSNRALLRKIFAMHREAPSLLSSRELYNIVKASMIIPREKLNQLLTQLTSEFAAQLPKAEKPKIKVFISGTFLEPLEIADYIEESGGVIVGDDLKNGSRYFYGDVPEEGDPMENLLTRQFNAMPSASFDNTGNLRSEFLLNEVKTKEADGILLLHLKYCEPENYDYYDMKNAMEEAGIPVLKFETEFGETSLGQLRTRVQAFIEMLSGGLM